LLDSEFSRTFLQNRPPARQLLLPLRQPPPLAVEKSYSERREERSCTFCPIAQTSNARLQNSVPLSTVILSGTPPLSCLARSNLRHLHPCHRMICFQPRVLPRELVDDRQATEGAPVRQRVTHKIHAPALVRAGATAGVEARCRRATVRSCFIYLAGNPS
jgi:hypothetical protein